MVGDCPEYSVCELFHTVTIDLRNTVLSLPEERIRRNCRETAISYYHFQLCTLSVTVDGDIHRVVVDLNVENRKLDLQSRWAGPGNYSRKAAGLVDYIGDTVATTMY